MSNDCPLFAGAFCPGVYHQDDSFNRVGIFRGETQCFVMDILTENDQEIPPDAIPCLVEIHDKVIANSAVAMEPMISALSGVISSWRANGIELMGRRLINYWSAIETAIVSSSGVTLLTLRPVVYRTSWVKQIVRFIDEYKIRCVVVEPDSLDIDMSDYPKLLAMNEKLGIKSYG